METEISMEWKYTLREITKNSVEQELINIYFERENKMKELLRQGMSWEEAGEQIESLDYNERIDKICFPNGKKKEKEMEIDKPYPIFRLLGTIPPGGGLQ